MILARRVSVPRKEMLVHTSGVWRGAKAQKISLAATPVEMQPSKYIVGKWKNGQYGLLKEMSCQAAHNGVDIAFRLEWANDTPSYGGIDNADFADGAAVLFPLTKDAPLIMGNPDNPVNIWYWRANLKHSARSNLAAGIGTSQVIEERDISVAAHHDRGLWSLVFVCAMTGGKDTVNFARGTKMNAAFAVWRGNNAERAGLKAFSPNWSTIELAA